MALNNPIVIKDINGESRRIQIVTLIGSNGELIEFTDNAIDINPTNTGIVDVGNSTNIPLDADEAFEGTPVEIKDYGVIYVTTTSNVASAEDGLSVQQSSDGINWDHTDEYTINADTNKTFSFQAGAQFGRVIYKNGSTDQSYFRLQTILKKGYGKPSSHRIQDNIVDDDDAELVKAVLTGKANGSFKNVLTTDDGDLKISDNSNGLSIAQGNVTGVSFIHKFGNAPNFDSSDNEVTIWDGADDGTAWEKMKYTFSTIADIDSLSSNNAADTQNIEVQGLDANYDIVIQSIQLNGQNRVALTTNLIRIYRMKNISSSDLNGHVFCFVNGTLSGGVPTNVDNIMAIIRPENNQTEMAVYTVPSGKTGYLRSWYVSTAGASKDSNYIIRLKARPEGQVFQLKHKSSISDSGTSYIQHEYVEPSRFEGKTDIIMTVDMTALGATGASISGGFDIVLVDN